MYVYGIRKLNEFKRYVLDHIRCDGEMAVVRMRFDRRHSLTCPIAG